MKRETAPRFAGIGGHHSHKAGTVEWLTPPEIIAALGPFDLDPCAPAFQPHPTAAQVFTEKEDGLRSAWPSKHRVWLNPPYANGVIELWLQKMASHGRGTALIFARTETDAFHRHVWERASGLLFMRGRINFHVGRAYTDERTGKRYEVGDRAPGNAGAPTVLCAYGVEDLDVLASCGIDGQLVPLRFPRSVLLPLFDPKVDGENGSGMTWGELVASVVGDGEEITVAEIFARVRRHPKAAGRAHARAKVRQELQRGLFDSPERGVWRKSERAVATPNVRG